MIKIIRKLLGINRQNSQERSVPKKTVMTKYSDDKEFYYEILLRPDGNYEVMGFQKVIYDDYGDTTVTYHGINDVSHITDTLERAVKIGDETLCNLTKNKKEKT